VNFIVKADFRLRHNLEGNMIILLTANRVFTNVRLNFKLGLGLAPVMSSQDKRSYNRLLSGEIEKASVRLS